MVGQHVFADMSGTVFVHDMCLILVPEVFHGGQHWVGGRLTEAAHGGILDRISQNFQHFQVVFFALAGHNLLKQLQHSLGADSAGDTVSARFVLHEVHEVSSSIHHAGIFIHNN